jgi:RimJ/RimL family protein N-acetyltransferase
MRNYKILEQNVFEKDGYEIVPIRSEDRYNIMQWRNEQIYHLRQDKSLTKDSQDIYFDEVVPLLFELEKPSQLLFSFLKDGELIGYGGLVHINWVDKNAEISFIMNTKLEEKSFEWNWSRYLELIEDLAFKEMAFMKLYVYAFDLRPHLYTTLLNNNYFLDARLNNHCIFNGELKDVLIYSKLRD